MLKFTTTHISYHVAVYCLAVCFSGLSKKERHLAVFLWFYQALGSLQQLLATHSSDARRTGSQPVVGFVVRMPSVGMLRLRQITEIA